MIWSEGWVRGRVLSARVAAPRVRGGGVRVRVRLRVRFEFMLLLRVKVRG